MLVYIVVENYVIVVLVVVVDNAYAIFIAITCDILLMLIFT